MASFCLSTLFRVALRGAFVALVFCTSAVSADDLESKKTRWLDLLEEQLAEVDEAKRQIAIGTAIFAFVDGGRGEVAEQIAMQQEDLDFRYQLLTGIAQSLAKNGSLDRATAILDSIIDSQWNERASHFVATEEAKLGQIEQAELLLQRVSHETYRIRIVSAICEHLISTKRFDEAQQRAEELADSFSKDELVRAIENARRGQVNLLEQISELWQPYIGMLLMLSEEEKFKTALAAIVAAQAQDRERVVELVDECVSDLNRTRNTSLKIQTSLLLAVALVEIGDNTTASKTVDTVIEVLDRDRRGLASMSWSPIILAILVRLERQETVDAVVEGHRRNQEAGDERFDLNYLLLWLGQSLIENERIEEFETRLGGLKTAEERCFFLIGAICGAKSA
ncbi:hypothetical protein SH449x_000929 [Pirellulaceae bacterium SH449]